MPTSKKPKRDYKEEYKKFHSSPTQIRHRSMKNQARRIMEKKYGDLKKTQEVDHIKPVSKGGTNSIKNLRIVSRKTNRKKGVK